MQAGVPIWATAGRGGGYVLDASASLPPVNLTPAQAVAVAVALAGATDAPFAADGHAALEKVMDVMGPGFSNGAGMAEHVATQRRCGGLVLFSGALPLAVLGVGSWPDGVPVQLHVADGDPMRNREWDEAFLADVGAAGAPVEVFEYPVAGHLFTDPSLPAEFDAAATELLWSRTLDFCARTAAGAVTG